MLKQRGRPFEKGNPGRPLGSKNKSTIALQSILGERGDEIMQKVVELALQGDPMALRLSVAQLLGPRRERTVAIDLPPINTSADVAKALSSIVASAAGGEITPQEATDLAHVVSLTEKAIETAQFEGRLRKLEERYE